MIPYSTSSPPAMPQGLRPSMLTVPAPAAQGDLPLVLARRARRAAPATSRRRTQDRTAPVLTPRGTIPEVPHPTHLTQRGRSVISGGPSGTRCAKKLTKKALKQPDQFIGFWQRASMTVGRFAGENAKALVIGISALATVVVGLVVLS